MFNKKDEKKKKSILKRHGWLLDAVTIFAIVIVILVGGVFLFQNIYKNKVFPGVRIGEIDFLGKKYDEVLKILKEKRDGIIEEKFVFEYSDKKLEINPLISSPLDPDLSRTLIDFELDKTAGEIINFGKKDHFLVNLENQFLSLVFGHQIKSDYYIDEKELKNILKDNFKKSEVKGENASLKIYFQKPKYYNGRLVVQDDYYIEVIPEVLGKKFDYDFSLNTLKEKVANLENVSVKMFLKTDYPQIRKDEISNSLLDEVSDFFELAPIVLKYKDQKWKIEKNALSNWLDFVKENRKIKIGFKKDIIENYIKENISPNIDKEPIEAKFKIENGKVSEFQIGKDGIGVNLEKTFLKIKEAFIKKNKTIEISTDSIKPKITDNNIKDFGVKEIIGIGESNFSGSPPIRIHNIRVGAAMINGILIKPDEEFSMIKALGNIDEGSDYKPELVIKGDETVKEYGGGLCQIGTTMFRTAVNSGLPITERRHHSYRVSYYEPAGTDATIYNPHPDFRFKNDTGNYILIQTKVVGSGLVFEFWGTNDGRVIEVGKPVIYNITDPPPKKEIVSDELEPGEVKCTEVAHKGADAYFNYKVIYSDGEEIEEIFRSHYIPWPAVCLIGPPKENEEELRDEVISN